MTCFNCTFHYFNCTDHHFNDIFSHFTAHFASLTVYFVIWTWQFATLRTHFAIWPFLVDDCWNDELCPRLRRQNSDFAVKQILYDPLDPQPLICCYFGHYFEEWHPLHVPEPNWLLNLIDLLQSHGSSPWFEWSRCSCTGPIWTWLAFPQIARLAL